MVMDVTRPEVTVHATGAVTSTERAYAARKVEHLLKVAPGPVLFAKVDLVAETDPARERPAIVKAEFDVNGRLVRAHMAAATMFEAIDLLESRLRQRLDRVAHYEEAKRLRHRGDDEHVWRHADATPPRPSYFPRPVEDRQVVRHKSFSPGESTPDEAAADLELLDHDFYLFTNIETGEDNVLVRLPDAEYELIEPTPTCSLEEQAAVIRRSPLRPAAMSIEDAVDLLNLGDERFVFFIDLDRRRGRVLYRRYDGHYGLIVPADEPS